MLSVPTFSGERKEKRHTGLGLGTYSPLEGFGEGVPTMHALQGDLTRILYIAKSRAAPLERATLPCRA